MKIEDVGDYYSKTGNLCANKLHPPSSINISIMIQKKHYVFKAVALLLKVEMVPCKMPLP